MNKVYAPQQPSRMDAGTRLWIPTVNLDDARRWGEVVVMLPPDANRLHTAPLVAAMKDRMADFDDGDHLIAVGDPSLIAAAACIAVRKTGGTLRMLKWDRQSSNYISVELKL
jgi:hypothetical protein